MLKNHKITNRKFYNKWLYKISLKVKDSYSFRRYLPVDSISRSPSILIRKLVEYFRTLDPKSYAIRTENSILDIYTNDIDIYNEILSRFDTNLRDHYVPNEHLLETSGDSHLIFAKKFPHDRYQYKIFLQPHKCTDRKEKHNYITWLEKQGDRIKISENVKNWFIKTVWNWDRRYMYAENEQMLLVLKLKNPEVLGTVYRFKIYDK